MAKRILLVDDDELLCDILRSFLEIEDFDVATAGNGQEALKILKTGQFDLIILDLMMPLMDGLRFLRLREDSHPPVLVLSASATGPVVEAAGVKGVVGVMRKPVDAPELLEAVVRALGLA